jgi:transcriptional regulator with AAA-type ATPase domain
MTFTPKLDSVRDAVDATIIRFVLTRALAESHGNVTRTAEVPGLSRKTMQTYMKDYLNHEAPEE